MIDTIQKALSSKERKEGTSMSNWDTKVLPLMMYCLFRQRARVAHQMRI